MANQEHVALLRQGVEAWNKWRENNSFVKPDLYHAVLNDSDFSGAYLTDTDLARTDLRRTDFRQANFQGADLRGADLRGANLEDASLWEANLEGANLTDANLSSAFLSNAKLKGACFVGTFLTNAYLANVQAVGTNFEGATLTGVCIQDWYINAQTNFNNVICDYLYLRGYPLYSREWSERRPHTGTFAPGEFTKLFQQSFDTIDLIFREGLDWKAFAYSFKQVEVLHEDAHLEVRSIENKGDGVVIVKVATAPDANKALIHSDFTQVYEAVSKTLAAQYEARLLDKDTQLAQQGTQINQLFGLLQHAQERLGEVPKLMSDMKGGDNYYGDIKAVNFTPHGNATGGVYNDFSNTQDLAQAAAQIQAVLAQLQQNGHSPESAQQQVANDLAKQADQDPALLGKLVKWGQKLGDATVTDVVKGVVKMALRAAGVPLP